MKRLRIVMLGPAPNQFGGVGEFVQMVSSELGARHELHTVCVGRDGSALPVALRMVRDGWRLVRTLLRVRPDLVHLNPSFNRAVIRDAIYLGLIHAIHHGPIVVFNHGWSALWPARIDRSRVLRWLVRRLYGGADRLYVLAGKSQEALLRWGITSAAVRSSSTMYDHAQFDGLVRCRPPPVEDGAIQMLFLSRLIPGKGAQELIHAFAGLTARFPRASLVIAGDGSDRPAIQAAARASGLVDRVSFPGFVRGRDKSQLLLDSDLFVFPTQLAEGCPVALLEALGAGLPVLASGVGGIVDVFASGAQGKMLSARPRAEEVRGALAEWLTDPERLGTAGAANRLLALRRYEAESWCQALEADYEALVAEHSGDQARRAMRAGQG